MIEHPNNRRAWAAIGNVIGDNILIEQYLLSACIDFHRESEQSKYNEDGIQYLFKSDDEAFDEAEAARVGFTHLIGGAKANPLLSKRLEDRVRRDYPESYERCLRVYSSTPALFE
jgi:hypothetical protein